MRLQTPESFSLTTETKEGPCDTVFHDNSFCLSGQAKKIFQKGSLRFSWTRR